MKKNPTHQVYMWSIDFFNSLLFLCTHVYTQSSYSEKPAVGEHINRCLPVASPMVSPLTFHHPSKKPTTVHSPLSLNSLLDCFPTGPHIPFLYQAYKVHLENEQWTSKKNKVLLPHVSQYAFTWAAEICMWRNIFMTSATHINAGKNPTYAEWSVV